MVGGMSLRGQERAIEMTDSKMTNGLADVIWVNDYGPDLGGISVSEVGSDDDCKYIRATSIYKDEIKYARENVELIALLKQARDVIMFSKCELSYYRHSDMSDGELMEYLKSLNDAIADIDKFLGEKKR